MSANASANDREFELFSTPCPEVEPEVAERIAADAFGIVGRAQELTSERDRNFHITQVTTAPQQEYVLKIANPLESCEVTDFQTRALLHLESHLTALAVPRVVSTPSGETFARIEIAPRQTSTVRLLTYVRGQPCAAAPSTPALRRNLGAALAHLGRALRDLPPEGADEELIWDLKNAWRLRFLLEKIRDANKRHACGRHLDAFDARIARLLRSCRSQSIYNDLNPSNALVHADDPERVTGIIDLGDMAHAPLVVDVAVAATYQLRHTDDPIDAAAELIAGYHDVTPLRCEEVDLLFDLIATRLVMSVLVSNWRAELFPENKDYILRHARFNWTMLERFDMLSREHVSRRLRSACGVEDA